MPGLLVRHLLSVLLFLIPMSTVAAQPALTLSESFRSSSSPMRVNLQVRMNGRLAVPGVEGSTGQVVPMMGNSSLIYDELPLPADEPRTGKLLRIYREVSFSRTIDGKEQTAGIRPDVRRMVVLRSERGKKAPFSPDGPLMWGEIDVVRTDLFSPVLVPGLLPDRPVRPGERWTVAPAAVNDLTDFDPIEEGSLTVTFAAEVTIEGKPYAKLTLSGTVKGVSEDGPARQKLDGTCYFDLAGQRLTYLNLNGTQQMLSPEGKVTGEIHGSFIMKREPAPASPDFQDTTLQKLDLRASDDSTALLYDNPALGVRFVYPRRWRVGAVQGPQITLDEGQGGGILLTVEPATAIPDVAAYRNEIQQFAGKQQWLIGPIDNPRRVAEQPCRLDRFGFDAEIKGQRVRLEYAVARNENAGATVAARLPWTEREVLGRDFERVVNSLTFPRRVER